MTESHKHQLFQDCRMKLQYMKQSLLQRMKENLAPLKSSEKSGDEADQTAALLFENQALLDHNRIRFQLLEIEYALARIESGTFGICEETFEPIEIERLRALPFTRLSIEGAEIREALQKQNVFA